MTVLDVADWAMTAAPYVPAVVIPSALAAAVYAAWHTTRAWRRRRAVRAEAARVAAADQRLGDRLHRQPRQAGPHDHAYRSLEQLYQMPAWEDETR
jgi:hypothetical protein